MKYKSQLRLRTPLLLLVAAGVLMTAPACSSRTPVVRSGPHRPADEPPPIRVRRPPPPAEVETLPLRRNPACYYQDGHHEPAGDGWKWVKGRWLLPPRGCYFAPPTTAYEDLEVGTALVFRPGVWHPFQRWVLTCAAPRDCPDKNAEEGSPNAPLDVKRKSS